MKVLLDFMRRLIPEQSILRLSYHKLMAVAAAFWYRFPSEQLTVIAVTGTNGKTTTCHMISAIFMEAGKKVGMLTTVRFRIGEKVWSNVFKQTTLSPFRLQKMLRQMVDEGISVAVIEATSHAMVQSRLWGVNVDTAVLTNIDRDHLEYHGSFEEYQRAKGLLFESLNHFRRKPRIEKMAVLNRGDASFEYMNRFMYDRIISYGFSAQAMVTAQVQEFLPDKVRFQLKVPNATLDISLPMAGRFNVENALAAIAVGMAHNIELPVMKAALSHLGQVPGRLEVIDEGQLFTIVVDYAHTPDALKKIMEIYKPVTEGKMIAVFGATGGGRDKSKRPEMGRIADTFADMVILTNDDPYREDQLGIIENIASGIKRVEGNNFWKIPDRRQAIKLALMLAKEGDTVIIAGKGGEEVIVIGDEKIPWDDRSVVRELLAREIFVEIEGSELVAENVYYSGK